MNVTFSSPYGDQDYAVALHTVVLPIIRVSLNNEIAISVVPNSMLKMYFIFQKKLLLSFHLTMC